LPTSTWNVTTIDGTDWLVVDIAKLQIPLDWDPNSGAFLAVAAPTGGLLDFPALVKGDPGDVPTFDSIVFTALEADDVTPDSATWTETSPDVWQLNLMLHKGPQGDPGDTIITPSDFGTAVAGKILIVNSTLDDFELATQKVGDRYVPASIASTPSGNAAYTLCSVSVPAQDFDWRPDVSGQTSITGTASNVRVDLIARLDNGTGGTPEQSGNIVGRSFGIAGRGPAVQVLSGGPPAAASATYDKVAAGVNAVIYLRAERIAGTGTFTTSADTTCFSVRVRPIP
jgi:hypothetical protein